MSHFIFFGFYTDKDSKSLRLFAAVVVVIIVVVIVIFLVRVLSFFAFVRFLCFRWGVG